MNGPGLRFLSCCLLLAAVGFPLSAQAPVLPLDDLAVFPYSEVLDDASTVLAVGALLMPAVLVTTPQQRWLSTGAQYSGSVLLAWGLKELGKSLVCRPRPYLYHPGAPAEAAATGDDHQSFPSGHTALAFTGAAFGTYLFGQAFPDSPWILSVAVTGYSLAAGTAALRVASGSHFLSDVAAGAAIGTVSGLLIPWLHKELGL